MPPELTNNNDDDDDDDEPRPTEAGDIYSLAMTILKLGTVADLSDEEDEDESTSVRDVYKENRPHKPATLGGLPTASFETLWLLMEKMWAQDPDERPTASFVVGEIQQLVAATSPSKVSAHGGTQ